jgi:hypothetical protein
LPRVINTPKGSVINGVFYPFEDEGATYIWKTIREGNRAGDSVRLIINDANPEPLPVDYWDDVLKERVENFKCLKSVLVEKDSINTSPSQTKTGTSNASSDSSEKSLVQLWLASKPFEELWRSCLKMIELDLRSEISMMKKWKRRSGRRT